MTEVGTVYDNRYKLLSVLGQGGFASTYLAEDLETNQTVVLKFPDITQLGDPAVYERFRREIAIGKLLNHPDLPIALSYSEGNPTYLVLRYVEGESLSAVIKKKQHFTVEEAEFLISNLLEVLYYCHERNIFHRDIKPENLVLGSDGRLKIIDFGIAVMEGATRVTYRGFSSMMGTPEYMSPEQIKGERGGARSDIYAVGCLFYYLLAGNPPYEGDNPLAVMFQHMTADIVPLTHLRKDVSPNLWMVIKKSLRRRKDERYTSALEMSEALKYLDKVDISLINQKDLPLSSVVSTKKSSWILIIIGIVLLILLFTLIVIFKKSKFH